MDVFRIIRIRHAYYLPNNNRLGFILENRLPNAGTHCIFKQYSDPFHASGGLISCFTSLLTDLTWQQRHNAILYIIPFCAAEWRYYALQARQTGVNANIGCFKIGVTINGSRREASESMVEGGPAGSAPTYTTCASTEYASCVTNLETLTFNDGICYFSPYDLQEVLIVEIFDLPGRCSVKS
jgi:hypothetical protein